MFCCVKYSHQKVDFMNQYNNEDFKQNVARIVKRFAATIVNPIFPGDVHIKETQNLWSDLDFDSMDEIDFVVNLEKHFGIKVDVIAKRLETVQDYIDCVCEELNKKQNKVVKKFDLFTSVASIMKTSKNK